MANACSLVRPATAAYTDAQAEAYAKEAGVPPRPQETRTEIDERGAFIRQPNAFIQPFGEGESDLLLRPIGLRFTGPTAATGPTVR